MLQATARSLYEYRGAEEHAVFRKLWVGWPSIPRIAVHLSWYYHNNR